MERTISVVGVGVRTSPPDIATVQLGIQVQAGSAHHALRRANEHTRHVIEAVRGAGVAAVDVRTSGPRLWPNERGYECSNDLSVLVRDVATTGEVIDAAAEAGGPSFRMSGVAFGIADPATLQSAARQAAMSNAKTVATELARSAGATLGEAVSISEGGHDDRPRPLVAMAAVAEATTPVAAGEETVQVQVQVTYRLNDTGADPPPP